MLFRSKNLEQLPEQQLLDAVQTNTCRAANTGHSAYDQSTITYPGGGNFAREKFIIHFNDNGQKPSFAALGLPQTDVQSSFILVICEEGALLVEAAGRMTVSPWPSVFNGSPCMRPA